MTDRTVWFREGPLNIQLKAVDLGDGTFAWSTIARQQAVPGVDIGNVGGFTKCIDVTPTLSVHATYASGDFIGTNGAAMVFADAARANAGTGLIVGAVLVDFALQSVIGELWLFDTAVTPPNDSAPWSISDAHAARCLGVIPFNTYYASALNSVCPVGGLTIAFQTLAASRALYGCFVTRGAPAYASGDLTFRLRVLQD